MKLIGEVQSEINLLNKVAPTKLTKEQEKDGLPSRIFNSFEEISKILEVQIIKRLPPHPNILKMYEVFYDAPSGKVFIVFENMESDLHTLNTDRPENETIIESKARSFIFQILCGLNHMHSNGFTHGDMNSRNILISKDSVKILPLLKGREKNIKINNSSAPELALCIEN